MADGGGAGMGIEEDMAGGLTEEGEPTRDDDPVGGFKRLQFGWVLLADSYTKSEPDEWELAGRKRPSGNVW